MLFEPFFEENKESAAILINLFLFLSNLTIIVTGFLMKDLSARHFVMLGSSLTFLGLVLTSLVTTLTQLIFTFSIMIGIGLGLLNPAAFVAVLSCFTCRRTYAISIGFAALGFGQMIMPMIVKQALVDYGLQSTLFIVSGLSLIGLLGGNFLVPIKWKPCTHSDPESQPLITQKLFGSTTILKEIIQATDLDLLWNFNYITIIFGLCIVYASSMNFNIIFPVYLQVTICLTF
jgi:MFS family permease